jgi:hypothetical protein
MPHATGRQAKPPAPPDDDKTWVMFSNIEHLGDASAQEVAFSLARNTAASEHEFGVIIQTTPSVQPETFRVMSALGHEAGATQVSLYVPRLK